MTKKYFKIRLGQIKEKFESNPRRSKSSIENYILSVRNSIMEQFENCQLDDLNLPIVEITEDNKYELLLISLINELIDCLKGIHPEIYHPFMNELFKSMDREIIDNYRNTYTEIRKLTKYLLN